MSSKLVKMRQASNEDGSSWWPAILIAVFVVLLVLSFVTPCTSDSDASTPGPLRKLQIGIKKRPEVCERKSRKGDILSIHYKGYLEATGVEFDSSYSRGQPLQFTLGSGQVISGWDSGLMGVCAGEKRKLVIPPEMGYGANGAPPKIPPNSVLVFEVEAVRVEDGSAANRNNEL